MLVYRANLYLLDALQYTGDPSKKITVDGVPQVGLPHVSAGFVSHNGLQSAVSDRVLNVQLAPSPSFTSPHTLSDLMSL